MVKYLALCIFITFCHAAISQPTVSWDRTYGSYKQDVLLSLNFTEDNGFLLAGAVGGAGGDANPNEPVRDMNLNPSGPGYAFADYWAIKTDASGIKIWDHRYGGDSLDLCWKVLQNKQGYLLIGQSNSNIGGDKTGPKYGKIDFWVVQIRPDGSKIWDRTYGGSGDDVPFSAVLTEDDGCVILGHSDSPDDGTKTSLNRGKLDLWLIKIDKNGVLLWDKDYGGSENDEYPANTLVKTTDGGFLIGCGSSSGKSPDKSENSYGSKDFWIIKVDRNGAKQWDKTYGGNSLEELFSIATTPDGGYLLGGTSYSSPSGNKKSAAFGNGDYWVIKISATGDIIWEKTFGGSGPDNLTFMYQNQTGYSLIGGVSASVPSGNKTDTLHGGLDWWFCYLDKEGVKVWDKTIGGRGNDTPQAWVLTPDKGYVIGGHSNSDIGFEKTQNAVRDPNVIYNADHPPANDMWLVKIKCVFDVDLGPDTAICKSATKKLDATLPNCPDCLYHWSTGETTPVITVTPEKSAIYKVSVTATDACETISQVAVNVIPGPSIASFLVAPPHCQNGDDGVIALDSSGGGTPPYYLIVDADTLKGKIFAQHISPGPHQISLVDKNGCALHKTVITPNPDSFIVQLPKQIELNFGDSFRLQPEYNHKLDTFYWSDRNIKVLDTLITPFETHTYNFTAVDSLGCSRSASEQVVVKKTSSVFAPNIFTPGANGRNDFFLIYGNPAVQSIDNVRLFDRWGNMVFTSPRIFPARDDAGWDGYFRGAPAPSGVYVYIAQVIYLDGRKEIIYGDVTLAR